MDAELTHPFLWNCLDYKGLLENCEKLNTFLGRLEKQSLKALDANKYKGDGLELFVEALIKLSPIDKRIGIFDYNIISSSDDTGVDGIGIGLDGTVATVQVKYRKADYILTANQDHLTNFSNASLAKYGVNPQSEENMLIITTAKDIDYYTHDEMLCGKVRVLNREKLRQLVDHNTRFWGLFLKLWDEAKARP